MTYDPTILRVTISEPSGEPIDVLYRDSEGAWFNSEDGMICRDDDELCVRILRQLIREDVADALRERKESEACLRGTIGCCVQHASSGLENCETW